MRVTFVSVITTAALCLPSLLGAEGAQAAIIKACPSAASLRSAAGTPLTLVAIVSGAVARCHYSHELSATKQDVVLVTAGPLDGSTGASLLKAAKVYAKSVPTALKLLTGFGPYAWEYTVETKADGSTTTESTVTIVIGKRMVTLNGNLPVKNMLAVAERVG